MCFVFQQERFATKRELNSLSQLAADPLKVFPPDFTEVKPSDVATKVVCVHVCMCVCERECVCVCVSVCVLLYLCMVKTLF